MRSLKINALRFTNDSLIEYLQKPTISSHLFIGDSSNRFRQKNAIFPLKNRPHLSTTMSHSGKKKTFLYGLWGALTLVLVITFWPRESEQERLMKQAYDNYVASNYEEALQDLNQAIELGSSEMTEELKQMLMDSLAVIRQNQHVKDSLRRADSVVLAKIRLDSLAFANASPEEREAYQTAFDQGEDFYQQKDWTQASRSFQVANDILPTPIAADYLLECQRRILDLPLPTMIEIPEGYFRKECEELEFLAFELAETEVTNEQFCVFLNEMGNQIEGGVSWLEMSKYVQIRKKDGVFVPKKGKESHPVMEVSWYGAQAYCKWLGQTFGLPTEAEWAYAAGWGQITRYMWAGTNEQDLREYANVKGKEGSDVFSSSSPVKSFLPNDLGLYDMSGNVWEWCQAVDDPCNSRVGTLSDSIKPYRGGSWNSNALHARVEGSFSRKANECSSYVGFRPVRRR